MKSVCVCVTRFLSFQAKGRETSLQLDRRHLHCLVRHLRSHLLKVPRILLLLLHHLVRHSPRLLKVLLHHLLRRRLLSCLLPLHLTRTHQGVELIPTLQHYWIYQFQILSGIKSPHQKMLPYHLHPPLKTQSPPMTPNCLTQVCKM